MATMTKIAAVQKYGASLNEAYEGEYCSSSEWLVGTFAGRSFAASSQDAADRELIEYFDNHIGHESIVGDALKSAGWRAGDTVELTECALFFQPEIEG